MAEAVINGNSGTSTQTGTPPVVGGNVLAGMQTFAATTAATTIITVPAGRTWVGTVTITCAVANAGALATTGVATGVVSTANGTGTVTPAAGNYARCDALAGANVAAGTVGTDASEDIGPIPFVVQASAAGTALVQVTATISGASQGQVTAMCAGLLQ